MNTFDGEVSEDSVKEKQRSVEVSSNREQWIQSISVPLLRLDVTQFATLTQPCLV